MENYTEITKNYLNFCKYQKGLNSKTIKAYTIDLSNTMNSIYLQVMNGLKNLL